MGTKLGVAPPERGLRLAKPCGFRQLQILRSLGGQESGRSYERILTKLGTPSRLVESYDKAHAG